MHNDNLHIASATADDSDLYSCEAKNSLGTSKKDFIVDVQTPPTFVNNFDEDTTNENRHVETELIVRIGDGVSLKCPVRGNPEPEIHWTVVKENDVPAKESEILTNNSTFVR